MDNWVHISQNKKLKVTNLCSPFSLFDYNTVSLLNWSVYREHSNTYVITLFYVLDLKELHSSPSLFKQILKAAHLHSKINFTPAVTLNWIGQVWQYHHTWVSKLWIAPPPHTHTTTNFCFCWWAKNSGSEDQSSRWMADSKQKDVCLYIHLRNLSTWADPGH